MIGRRLGKYEIESDLGSGAMARVFRGHHVHLDRPAAIKVLHEHLAEQEGFRERFLREARAVAQLDDPRIVRIYDYDYEDGVCYIAMELLEGASLEERLRLLPEGSRLPLSQVLRIVQGVGGALGVAHDEGLVHRDVKPSNVMVTDDRVVLTDFGIAASLDQTRLTADGSTSGTPAYMSPEQASGNRGDPRSDVYALGVLLYQLSCGELPFTADNPYEMIRKHVDEAPVPPSERAPDAPRALDAVVMRALAKAPEERYDDVRAMVSDLREALAGSATQAELETFGSVSGPGAEATTARPSPVAPTEGGQGRARARGESSARSRARSLVAAGLLVILTIVSGWVLFRAWPSGDPESEPLPSMAAESEAGGDDGLDAMTAIHGWSDGFVDNARGWRLSTGEVTRRIADGAFWFEVRARDRAASTWAEAGGVWSDFRYSAVGTLVEGQPESGYGLVFRRADARNYYVFAVNGLGQWSIWMLGDGAWRSLRPDELWAPDDAIAPAGEPNRLEVTARGSAVTLFVNGVQVHRLDRPGLDAGGVGFYVATSRSAIDAEAVVRFDEASVEPLEASTGGS